MDILSIAQKTKEIVESCESIYGDRWEVIRKAVREKELQPHHEEHKTVNLLASAIKLCEDEDDPKVQMILIASSFDKS